MSKCLDHLESMSALQDAALALIARNEGPEREEVREQVRALEAFAAWHYAEAQKSARWLYGSHRYPIAPEREADWFANRYGLAHYFVSDADRVSVDRDWQSWGKFDSQFAEVVWSWSLESGEPSLLDSEDEYASPIKFGTLDLLAVFPLLCEEFPAGDVPAGAIVWTDSRGFVTVDYFDTAEELDSECEAVRGRVEEQADSFCEEVSCERCDQSPQCEEPFRCEHSAHECYRADWLPSLADRPAKPATGSTLAEELRDAERWLAGSHEGSEDGERGE